MAVCFAVGREGENRMLPVLSTPRGTVTSTALAVNVVAVPRQVAVTVAMEPAVAGVVMALKKPYKGDLSAFFNYILRYG